MVLVTFDHALAARRVSRLTGVVEDLAYEAIYGSNLELDYEWGKISTPQFLDTICQRLGVSIDHDTLFDAVGGIFQLDPHVFPLVTRLKSIGIPLGILSNTCEAHWQWIRRQGWGLLENFSTIVLSYEERSMKPQEEIYAVATARAEVAAGDILFLDDRGENIEGAMRAGWQAIPYSTPPAAIRALYERGIPLFS